MNNDYNNSNYAKEQEEKRKNKKEKRKNEEKIKTSYDIITDDDYQSSNDPETKKQQEKEIYQIWMNGYKSIRQHMFKIGHFKTCQLLQFGAILGCISHHFYKICCLENNPKSGPIKFLNWFSKDYLIRAKKKTIEESLNETLKNASRALERYNPRIHPTFMEAAIGERSESREINPKLTKFFLYDFNDDEFLVIKNFFRL